MPRTIGSTRANEHSRPQPSRARQYYRGWRAPRPRRKSTKPRANSRGREVTLPTSNCSRTRARPTKYLPLSLVNRPTSIAAAIAVLPSRLGRVACPSEIAVIDPPLKRTSCDRLYISKFNERWRPPTESIVLDEAENQSFFGFQIGSAHPFRKSVVFQKLRKRPDGLTLVTFFSKAFTNRG